MTNDDRQDRPIRRGDAAGAELGKTERRIVARIGEALDRLEARLTLAEEREAAKADLVSLSRYRSQIRLH
jgi:hypothetical protein